MTKHLEKALDLETARKKADSISFGPPKKWSGTKYKTTCCDDIIQSKYSGEYVLCKCGKVAIDETPHYGRVIGDINMLEVYKEE